MIRSVRIVPYAVRATVRGAERVRHGWWVSLVDELGLEGHGDAASWPGFGADDASIVAALHRVGPSLHGLDDTAALATIDDEQLPAPARHAFQLALFNMRAQRLGRPLANVLRSNAVDRVATHARVRTGRDAHLARMRGFTHVKLKVGGPVNVAVQQVEDVAAAGLPIRVDVNAGWDVASAGKFLRRVRDLAIDYVEQPVATLDELRRLERSGIRIAADELACHEPFDAVLDTADVVVLKPMFVGGPAAAVALADRAAHVGRDVVVTHALESPVGRRGAMHVAAAIGRGVHGVGRIHSTVPFVTIGDCPGLGVGSLESAA